MGEKKILVPIDFSGCSIKALKVAIDLAKKIEARLIIMNSCQQPIAYSDARLVAYSSDLLEVAKTNAKEAFEVVEDRLKELADVIYEFRLQQTFPQDAIISATLSEKIDLIVMGTTGASGIKSVLMGSNTYAVIKNVTCPVLAIPIESPEEITFNKIVLAGDFEHTDKKETFQLLIDLAKAYGSEIDVLHVSETTFIKTSEEEEAEKLDKHFRGLKHSFHFKLDKHIDVAIQEYLEENKADLLTTVAKQHSLLDRIFKGSVTQKMVYHSTTPLLVLHHNPA